MNRHTYRHPSPPGAACSRRVLLSAACGLGPAWASGFPLQATSGGRRLETVDRIALALMRFHEGFHCSQSVLEAYALDFGLEADLARRMAAPLAGGSTAGGECGVVGSGYLVLGLRYAGLAPAYGDTDREERLWSRVRKFLAEFERRNGAITCQALLGLDAFTREGRKEALRRDLFAARCYGFIRSGIEILDSLD